MIIRQTPRDVTNIKQLDTSNIHDPAPGSVENPTTSRMSLNYSESFENVSHPTAIDKMLLPASPGLDPSTVEGNFEKQMQMIDHEKELQMLLEAQKEKAIVVQSEIDNELKIREDEKMEQLFNARRLTNLKI
jgi:hypothetical protein